MDCTEVEEGYKVRYTPLAPGDYYISIKYNNNHIVGSPFRVHSTGKYSKYTKEIKLVHAHDQTHFQLVLHRPILQKFK